MIRLQKFLADAGVASRRAGEKLILEGKVEVNGETVSTLGSRVDASRDEVRVEGRTVRPRKKLYVALHKPPGVVTTRADPEARPTVLSLLPAEWKVVFPVGRLDRDSEGLLLLTNDGDLCLRLTHPRYGIRKTYVVTVAGRIEPAHLKPMRDGVRDRGERLQAVSCRILSAASRQSRVEVVLAEGKNREVRRLFAAAGFEVERLVRVQVGPVRLGELPVGKWRTLTPVELARLRELTEPTVEPLLRSV